MGIDSEWTKICVHMLKDNGSFNLPRIIYAKKSWTLKQLHIEFYREYRDIFYRWFKDIKETGKTEKSRYEPKYLHPETGE